MKLHEPTLQTVISHAQKAIGPILLENGKKSLHEALKEAEQNGANFIDMMILSVFEGSMPKKYIEEEFYTKWLDENMQVAWESPKFETKVKAGGQEASELATLKFIVYLKKISITP